MQYFVAATAASSQTNNTQNMTSTILPPHCMAAVQTKHIPKFIDSQQRMLDHPETWKAISLSDLSDLAVGDHVKVGLQYEQGEGERFWTIVTALENEDVTATVNNVLAVFPELEVGHQIKFQRKNIIEHAPPQLSTDEEKEDDY